MLSYYQKYEWLRWTLFVPTVLIAFFATLAVFWFSNLWIADSWTFKMVVFPAVAGATMIFLLFSLAPRWKTFFFLAYILLGLFSLLCGVLLLIWQSVRTGATLEQTFIILNDSAKNCSQVIASIACYRALSRTSGKQTSQKS